MEKAFQGYLNWNEKINVISRKDIENLATRHFLHSLAIAKVIDFLPKAHILDAGTGGGFPGIPLAILYPETQFHLVDSRQKKITVVQEIGQECGLTNVQSTAQRVEQLGGQYDFVVSRAVTSMDKFIPWVLKQIKPQSLHPLKNGIIYLRGGDIEKEMKAFPKRRLNLKWKVYPIRDFFEEEFFAEKSVLHVSW
ncbi:UNVERIFIED_CONTAM: hypothetical protein GTU68_037736 [Idotea baltica]|nr:hypothetical protein [Idotea baltica]